MKIFCLLFRYDANSPSVFDSHKCGLRDMSPLVKTFDAQHIEKQRSLSFHWCFWSWSLQIREGINNSLLSITKEEQRKLAHRFWDTHVVCDHLNKKSASREQAMKLDRFHKIMLLIAEEDTLKLNILKNMDCKVLKQRLFAEKFLPIICW